MWEAEFNYGLKNHSEFNEAPQFYDRGEAALVRLNSFGDKGLTALDELLTTRIDAMKFRLTWISAVVLLDLLLAAYFF